MVTRSVVVLLIVTLVTKATTDDVVPRDVRITLDEWVRLPLLPRGSEVCLPGNITLAAFGVADGAIAKATGGNVAACGVVVAVVVTTGIRFVCPVI